MMIHSVVKLHAETINHNPFVPFEKDSVNRSTGTAFFISDTRLLTCHHCVEDAVTVSISSPPEDKNTYRVRVVAVFPFLDLALLECTDFPHPHDPLALDTNVVEVLESVVTVGFPLDMESLKYTTGVVSGTKDELIQIDAPINPGNSGGPLLRNGKVIGINSQKLSNAELIGFAVPIRAFSIWDDFIKNVTTKTHLVVYPFDLYIRTSNLNPDAVAMLKDRRGFPANTGILITHSHEELLKTGDIIFGFNHKPVDNFGMVINRFGNKISLFKALLFVSWGDTVTLDVFRKDRTIRVPMIFSAVKDKRIRFPHCPFEKVSYLVLGGIVFMELNLSHLDLSYSKIGMDEKVRLLNSITDFPFERIVFISSILIGSPITMLENIRVGSIVKAVNGKAIRTLNDLDQALRLHTDYLQMQTMDAYFIYPYSKLLVIDELLHNMYEYDPWKPQKN